MGRGHSRPHLTSVVLSFHILHQENIHFHRIVSSTIIKYLTSIDAFHNHSRLKYISPPPQLLARLDQTMSGYQFRSQAAVGIVCRKS